MYFRNIFSTAFVAFAFLAANGRAQVIPGIADLESVIDGDFILGAHNASAANDLVIDLGSFTQFQGLTPGVTYDLMDVKVADFTSTFGADVFTTAGTTWTVFGGVGTSGIDIGIANSTLWGAAPWSGSTYNIHNRAPGGLQFSTSNAFDTFTNSLFGGTSLLGHGAQNLQVGPGSFTQLIGPGGNFGYFPSSVETSTVGTGKLELFELVPGSGAGVDLGTFTLSDKGATFTAFQPVPEPSASAAILSAATLVFAASRRRKQAPMPAS